MKITKGLSGPTDIYFKREDAMRDEFRRDKSRVGRDTKHKVTPVQGDPYAYDEDEILADLDEGYPVESLDVDESNDPFDDYEDFYDVEEDEYGRKNFDSSKVVDESWIEGGDVTGHHMTRRDKAELGRLLRDEDLSEARARNPINQQVRRMYKDGPTDQEISLEEIFTKKIV